MQAVKTVDTPRGECDATCPQLACFRVFIGARILEFCGHHFRRHESAIRYQGYDWQELETP